MEDKRQADEKRAKARLPPLIAIGVAIFAFVFTESLATAVFTLIGFAIGSTPVEKWAFWIDPLEERRQKAKPVLLQLTDPEIESVNTLILQGQKIEAIKTIRAITGAGLQEAKTAMELLEDFGLRWLDVLEEKG